jgi:hypothetical protein
MKLKLEIEDHTYKPKLESLLITFAKGAMAGEQKHVQPVR